MAIITEIRRKLPLRPHRQEENEQSESKTNEIHQICVDDIIPNRSQPRSAFNQNAIARLQRDVAMIQLVENANGMHVMVEVAACSLVVAGGKETLAGVTEGRVPEVMPERYGLDEIAVKSQ